MKVNAAVLTALLAIGHRGATTGGLSPPAKASRFAPDYDAIKAGGHDQNVQYESFVSYFLYACEEATAAFADKREWVASCNYDLKPHLPFLCEKSQAEPAYLETYSRDTQQWVKASMNSARVTPPDCKLGKT